MELRRVLAGLEKAKVKGSIDMDITNLDSDSRNIKENGMFVAIKGFDTDGHKYINNAIENGAKVIIVEEGIDIKTLEIPAEVTLIVVPDTRKVLALCACNFYDNPSTKFRLIGVTGTKGKTTTTFMLKDILEKMGQKVGLIGTVAVYIGDKKIENCIRTTPESAKLQSIFAKMVEENVDTVVMEVSSQGLKLDRVDRCNFDMAVFTNFGKEHISPKEHDSVEDYFESKAKLFDRSPKCFINTDDIYGVKLINRFKESNKEIRTYGIDNFANLLAKDITVTNSYVDFKVKLGDKNQRVKTSIPGRFSVYNSLAAIYVALELGATPEQIIEALEQTRVPGRSELVDNKKGLTIMVDYAHTPESMQSIIQACKEYTKGRIICVFGCGGDRDSSKRHLMGEVAGRLADYSIITQDNSRTEDPNLILAQIEQGTSKTKGNYEVIKDRKEAIKKAIQMANKSDMILILGKGHETYQEINNRFYPFDEKEIIKELTH